MPVGAIRITEGWTAANIAWTLAALVVAAVVVAAVILVTLRR